MIYKKKFSHSNLSILKPYTPYLSSPPILRTLEYYTYYILIFWPSSHYHIFRGKKNKTEKRNILFQIKKLKRWGDT